MDIKVFDIYPIDCNSTRLGQVESLKKLDYCRFTTSRWPYECYLVACLNLQIHIFENILVSRFILKRNILEPNVAMDSIFDHLRILSHLDLLLIFRIENFKNMGGSQLSLINVWYKMTIVSDCYSCKENLIDCCEYVQKRYAIVLHE